ncbi:hypothetical protein AQUCO_00900651v1 [Aquilegia coerulea]|uniref:Nuclear pore complex protein NUP1 n=1 Tax=Aquilegia coerulea TaxID=218851 RepID=A0A2G5EER7_AQUCA|nr:hypothetical protein AQUCO_00900651v1 [Aquilegia coerulea]
MQLQTIHKQKNKRWISKLVDPASRIITNTAHKLFSSVSRNNLPALPMISEGNHESRDAFHKSDPSGDQVGVSDERENLNNNADGGAMNDIEQIFKQKTFTRAEIDRLTELLQSRTSDVSSEDEKIRFKTSTSHLVEASGAKGSDPVQKREVKSPTSLAIMSAPSGNLNVLGEAIASPMELAKAYMGSRTSKVTPSTLRYRDQTSIQDVSLQNSVQFTPNSHSTSLVPKTTNHHGSAPRGSEYGYLTPVPRGRSAIYSMARTPHSRVHHTAIFKGVGSLTERTAGPSTSTQKPWENNLLSGGKQASKRRSSVLDSDVGSVCPIRRVRRKTNMMFPSESTIMSTPRASLSNSLTPISSQAATVASIQKQLKLNGSEHNVTGQGRSENGESSVAGKRYFSVPTHSTRTAQKILQQLEALIPSPKGKTCERKETVVMEESPSKLMPDVRHKQALKSSEDVDSAKLLHNAHNNGVLVGLGDNHTIGDSPSNKQVRVDENGPTKISVSEDMIEADNIGVVSSSSAKNTTFIKSTEAFTSCSVANDPQKKQACETTANEDSLELEDNKFSSSTSSNPSIFGKEICDKLLVESKEIADGTVTVGESIVSLADAGSPESFMRKSSDIGASNNYPDSEKNVGFTGTFTKPALSTSLSTSSFDKTSSPNQSAGVQFSFSSKSVEKGPLFTFSSASAACESSGGNAAQSEAKLQTVSSTATPRNEHSHGSCNGENFKGGDLHSKDIVSSSKSASTFLGVFSFGASTKSSLSNGSPALSTSIFSVPTSLSVSDTTSNVLLTNPTTITSSTSPTGASTSAASLFRLGSSTSTTGPPSNSASILPATIGKESTDSELKTNCTSLFGGLKNSPFGTTTSVFTGSSSAPFVFGASASSCADSQFQSSNISGAASGLSSFVQATAGSVSTPFTQSMSMQFGSSTSSQTFGLTGPSPFSSGGSLFGSSAPGAKPFESGSSALMNNSNMSTGGTSLSLFGPSGQSAPACIFGSTSSTIGFKFGSSSATSGSTPTPFGSSLGPSSGSVFSFTSAATVTPPLSTSAATVTPPLSTSAATVTPPLTTSFPVFTAVNPVSSVGLASQGNHQMNIEDSMAEDTVQPSTSVVPVFSQPSYSSQPSTFAFGASSSSGGPTTFQFGSQQNLANLQNQGGPTPFQFGSQQNPANLQSPSPFQASGSFDFAAGSAGGSFSLGTGGGEKSNRRYFKARRDKSRNR